MELNITKQRMFILVPFTEMKHKSIVTVVSEMSKTNSRQPIFVLSLMKVFKNCNGFASVA